MLLWCLLFSPTYFLSFKTFLLYPLIHAFAFLCSFPQAPHQLSIPTWFITASAASSSHGYLPLQFLLSVVGFLSSLDKAASLSSFFPGLCSGFLHQLVVPYFSLLKTLEASFTLNITKDISSLGSLNITVVQILI